MAGILAGCAGGASGSSSPAAPTTTQPATASEFVYAASKSGGGITANAFRIGSDGSLGALGTALQSATFIIPGVPDANGHHLFGLEISATGAESLVTFSVQPSNGSLERTSSIALPADAVLLAVGFNPSKTLMFTATTSGQSGGTLSTYAINAAAGLTLAHTVDLKVPTTSIVVNPAGTSLYAAIFGPGATTVLTQYAIDATGGLTQVSSLQTALQGGINVAMAPSGKALYLAMVTPPQIATFAIDPSTGKLTQVAIASCGCVATGQGLGVFVNAKGTLLLESVAGSSMGSGVLPYSIDVSTGALTPLGNSFIVLGSQGLPSFLLNASGSFLYGVPATHDQILGFSLSDNGAATPVPGSPYAQATDAGLAIVNFQP